jgi:hypothetical protein
MDKQIFQMLIALIDSGYAKPEFWIKWADRLIDELPSPSNWLIELSLKNRTEDALLLLREQNLMIKGKEDIDYTSTILGYLYMRYKEGDLSFKDFLHLAWEETEEVNYKNPSNSELFNLYKCNEKLVQENSPIDELLSVVNSVFVKHLNHAQLQLGYITGKDIDKNQYLKEFF